MNTAGTYVIIGLIFAAIFGGMAIIGQQALQSNPNLDSDSIAEIANLDKNLDTIYKINTTSGNITGFKTDSTASIFEGVDPFEKELAISRGESTGTLETIKSVKNVPDSVLGALPFVQGSSWTFYLDILATFLTAFLFFAGYKFWKQGRADNS